MTTKTQTLLGKLMIGIAIPFSLVLHASLFSETLKKSCQLVLGIHP
jgi:hypothetical protein